MKWGLLAALLLGAALVAFGPPGAVAERAPRYGGTTPILAMTFAHSDHFAVVACKTCHHEFADRLMGLPCMTCHVTDAKVSGKLEEQFHTLCRSCHVEERAAGKPSGPTRRCIACHLPDDET